MEGGSALSIARKKTVQSLTSRVPLVNETGVRDLPVNEIRRGRAPVWAFHLAACGVEMELGLGLLLGSPRGEGAGRLLSETWREGGVGLRFFG